MKQHLYKLPFWFKLWWAKQLNYMFRGLGPTFYDDICLHNELSLWIEKKGKPVTSSFGYKEKAILDKIKDLQKEIRESPDNDPRDAYEIRHWQNEIVSLELELDHLRSTNK